MGSRFTVAKVTLGRERSLCPTARCAVLRWTRASGHDLGLGSGPYASRVPSAVGRSLARMAALVLAFGVSGCGGGGDTQATQASSPFDAAPTTTVAALAGPQAAPTVAPLLGTSSAVAASSASPARGLDTPDAASQNLWDSWRDNDRSRALLFASRGAVDTLFETGWQPDARNVGCGTSVGVNRCVYTFTEGTQLVGRLVIIDGTDATGYRASRVEQVGDLPTTNRLDSPLVDDTLPVGTGTDAAAPVDQAVGSDAVASGGTGSISGAATATGADPATAAAPSGGAAPTVPGSVTTPTSRGSAARSRVTTKRKAKTTRRESTTATTVAGEAPVTPPDPAPAPPVGPVQVGGQTVDTVAPG